MRFAAYNIEWLDDAFTNQNEPKADHKRYKSAPLPQVEALGNVLAELDADVIGITEGPNTAAGADGVKSTVKCLERLAADAGLRARKALIGFNAGRQEIALMFDPDKVTAKHAPSGRAATSKPKFDEDFQLDADLDGLDEIHKHDRPPLEVKLTRKDTDTVMNLFVVHAKSKGIFNNTDRLHWERQSERNRRRLYAQAASIRDRVDDKLSKGEPVVVMGDINDGPGMDEHEAKFGRSAVEVIMGDIFEADKILNCLAGRPKWGQYGWKPSTARFTDNYTGDPVNVMIDFILTSQDITPLGDEDPYKIWNPYEIWTKKEREKPENQPLFDALRSASDHFPVTLDFE
ncbi:MAG: endonuclease/exonuclease/phosphatase family protein [Pseudomonadota bacterium]